MTECRRALDAQPSVPDGVRLTPVRKIGRALRAAGGVLNVIWSENEGVDRWRFLVRGLYWQIQKRFGVSFTAVLANGARVSVHPSSAYSGIFYGRWFERNEILFLRKNATLGSVFVDVGANVGIYSALLFDRFERFYLFEPAFSSYRAIKETCALNPEIDCRVMNIAISDREGTLTFLDEGDFSTTSRIVSSNNEGQGKIHPVQTNTLDAILCEEHSIILKVDVEGLEEQVFRGAERLFRDKHLRLVLFERLGRTNLSRIETFLSQFGYVVFALENGRVTLEKTIVQQPCQNLFACPSAVFGQLKVAGDDSAVQLPVDKIR